MGIVAKASSWKLCFVCFKFQLEKFFDGCLMCGFDPLNGTSGFLIRSNFPLNWIGFFLSHLEASYVQTGVLIGTSILLFHGSGLLSLPLQYKAKI